MIEQVAAEIAETYGVETLAVPCDITSSEQVSAAVKAVMDRFGRIDILVNNAGTGAVAPAEQITDEQFENELNIAAIGWALYNNAANAGDAETALTILRDMVTYQRNAAQAVQATRSMRP